VVAAVVSFLGWFCFVCPSFYFAARAPDATNENMTGWRGTSAQIKQTMPAATATAAATATGEEAEVATTAATTNSL
jgi:hypothetical protein